MKSPAFYLLEVLFCSGLLLAFYRLLLVRKVSFAACRRYLVAAMLLSVAIPALDIPLQLPPIHLSPPTRQAEISYAVFCLKKKKKTYKENIPTS